MEKKTKSLTNSQKISRLSLPIIVLVIFVLFITSYGREPSFLATISADRSNFVSFLQMIVTIMALIISFDGVIFVEITKSLSEQTRHLKEVAKQKEKLLDTIKVSLSSISEPEPIAKTEEEKLRSQDEPTERSKLQPSKADLLGDETIYSVVSVFNSEADLFLPVFDRIFRINYFCFVLDDCLAT